MTHPYPYLSLSQSARYCILVQGWLGESWEEWFEGMHLTHHVVAQAGNDPSTGKPIETTLLTGVLHDQAALIGMLERLYAIGLPILKVEFLSRNASLSDELNSKD